MSLSLMPRRVAVVAHSHWDREWYASFESYRTRLVKMMDGLLDLLDRDPAFAHFHLDGQVAVLDDYLEVRPEEADRVRRLLAGRRLSLGPWYVLMDEFCVSAETIVRNLQLGLARSAGYGADPATGYLPDMFGHVSQMPQILARAGFDHAVVWRGVPSTVTRTAFRWEAPDGSTVRAEYLPVGYSAGAHLPPDPDALAARMAAFEQEIGAYLPDGWPILLTNGGDHLPPEDGLPAVLEAANRSQDRFVFEQTSIDAYTAGAPTDGLDILPGELRSGFRSPVLAGVLSNRVDVKQAAAAAETLLERVAEPLATLWLPPELWPQRSLDRAWLEVIRNSAHDSICACSADQVGRAVLSRYDTAVPLAEDVAATASEIAAVAMAEPGVVVLNPLPFDRAALVELDLPGTEAPPGTQQLSAREAAVTVRRGFGRDLATIKGQLTGEGWLRQNSRGERVRVEGGRGAGDSEEDGLAITLVCDPTLLPDPDAGAAGAEAWTRAGAGGDRPLTVRVERAASQRVLTRVTVPGWGWATVDPGAVAEPGAPPVTASRSAGGAVILGNSLVEVVLSPDDGTFSLAWTTKSGEAGQPGDAGRVAGLNRLVEEPDAGDTYTFSPADPGRPQLVDTPKSVDVILVEGGPLRALARVRRTYRWSGDTEVEVVSDVEVRAGERLVRIATSLDHHGGDRRVRAHFPLPEPADVSRAECAFALVTRRNSDAEGGPQEVAATTFPSRRFVSAGGLTVTHRGLLEYELLDGPGRPELALTLLRATGTISKPNPSSRPVAAGPPVPTRDTQMPGPITLRYAVAPAGEDPWDLADHAWTPLPLRRSDGTGHLPAAGRRLSVAGARVSALYRREGAVEVRMFNPSPDPAVVTVADHSGMLVDLRGRPLPGSGWDGRFELAPWAFATARLSSPTLDR